MALQVPSYQGILSHLFNPLTGVLKITMASSVGLLAWISSFFPLCHACSILQEQQQAPYSL